jgi:trimethylamine--corrinoid protein Co-methyltransferase
MTIGMAADKPPEIADRVIARQVLTCCEKPFVFCCKDANGTRDIYEMAVLIAGGESLFHQAPFLVHYSEPISPLLYFEPAIEKIIFCAERGIPIINFPAPQAGSTSPATFAGTIVQGSAESLSGLMAQMAQHYELPFFGTAGCTDAKFPDPQAAAEVAFSCLSSALSGANLIHDAGSWIDHGSVVSPSFMVLVDEVLHMVKQYMQGVEVSEETLALDLIDRIGPGGHYLNEDHTMRHFRRVWYPELFDRTIYDDWHKQGAKRFEERLREKTLQTGASAP